MGISKIPYLFFHIIQWTITLQYFKGTEGLETALAQTGETKLGYPSHSNVRVQSLFYALQLIQKKIPDIDACRKPALRTYMVSTLQGYFKFTKTFFKRVVSDARAI